MPVDLPYAKQFVADVMKLEDISLFPAIVQKVVTGMLGDSAGGLALSYLGKDALADPELFVIRARETLGFGSIEILRSISKFIEEREADAPADQSQRKWKSANIDA